jgi:hypothetical protein
VRCEEFVYVTEHEFCDNLRTTDRGDGQLSGAAGQNQKSGTFGMGATRMTLILRAIKSRKPSLSGPAVITVT